MRNAVWQVFFEALYPVWGFVGVLVAFNYGAAAKEGWRTDGGTWGHAGIEWARIVGFVIGGCAHDVWCILSLRDLKPDAAAFAGWGYSPGHLLRFFIMLSFVTSATFGFMLIGVDRSGWEITQLVATAFAVSCSIVAGLGHLFIAWRFKARRWRWTALTMIGIVPAVVCYRLYL